MNAFDVAIIGAGPYGLSLASFVRNAGLSYKIFGTPMSFWRENVPPGMDLKSEGPASDLFAPGHGFPLKDYYNQISRSFSVRSIIPAKIFADYGIEFQKRFVPDVDMREVVSVHRSGAAFLVRLSDGGAISASRIVMANGIRDYAYIPEVLSSLPRSNVSHTIEYGSVDKFLGQKVFVIGAGASAVNLAWAIHERGIETAIICREPEIKFHPEPPPRKWSDAIRSPNSPIGGGWALWFYANAPQLFHLLPEKTRHNIVSNTLGPAPGWVMTERAKGKFPIHGGRHVVSAELVEGRVELTTKTRNGMLEKLTADHVVAASGYRVDIEKSSVLDEAIKRDIRTAYGSPVLSGNFESSVPGLYFIGLASAESFGPVMRFVAGAGYAVRKVSRYLAATRSIDLNESVAPGVVVLK